MRQYETLGILQVGARHRIGRRASGDFHMQIPSPTNIDIKVVGVKAVAGSLLIINFLVQVLDINISFEIFLWVGFVVQNPNHTVGNRLVVIEDTVSVVCAQPQPTRGDVWRHFLWAREFGPFPVPHVANSWDAVDAQQLLVFGVGDFYQ